LFNGKPQAAALIRVAYTLRLAEDSVFFCGSIRGALLPSAIILPIIILLTHGLEASLCKMIEGKMMFKLSYRSRMNRRRLLV
jgi:hypothetical protein